jgi:hypothetical protein
MHAATRGALLLSNAKYGELIGSKSREDQERARYEFYNYIVIALRCGREFADWQEAWAKYSPVRAVA